MKRIFINYLSLSNALLHDLPCTVSVLLLAAVGEFPERATAPPTALESHSVAISGQPKTNYR